MQNAKRYKSQGQQKQFHNICMYVYIYIYIFLVKKSTDIGLSFNNSLYARISSFFKNVYKINYKNYIK